MRGSSFILLGSNIGNREKLLNDAIVMIELRCGKVILKSSLYESEPWGFNAEQNFINQAICIETDLSAHDLLKELLDIELKLGRKRSTDTTNISNDKVYESRPIDLDIIYYGNMINNDEVLELPHPRMHLRKFVLYPLCEIAPDYIHPILNKTNRELRDICRDFSEVKLYEDK